MLTWILILKPSSSNIPVLLIKNMLNSIVHLERSHNLVRHGQPRESAADTNHLDFSFWLPQDMFCQGNPVLTSVEAHCSIAEAIHAIAMTVDVAIRMRSVFAWLVNTVGGCDV